MRQQVTILFLLVYMLPAIFSGNMLINISASRLLLPSCSNNKMQDQPAPGKFSPTDHHPNRHPAKAKPVSPTHFFVSTLPAAFNTNSVVMAAEEKNIFPAAIHFTGNYGSVWQPPRLS